MNANPLRDFVADQPIARPAPVAVQPSAQQPVSSTAECGSGWYHDAAIQESKQTPARKH